MQLTWKKWLHVRQLSKSPSSLQASHEFSFYHWGWE